MSQTIDERVVEMRFDNKQFESGAKQTMSTLARLKEALKLPDTTKALEGIDEATKNISLDGIVSGVEALNNRFSTLGIVGMRVIENVADGLMNKLNKAVGFVTDSIVSGGVKRAMNIENAHFQLQALLKDETKVQAVMADAMESVDGTAYAYDEAAKAAAQFSASGIQAGDDMLGALKGITGVAAMTNSQFADISMIFTTVAGNGRLMGDQLLQLSSRGLNAASTLADYFKEVRGQANMTEGTIREMVSKGQISFKDFSDAMTWAFGDSAKRANETFTGAMSNMKSALARIGAGFISPLVEQNGELVQLFNALRIKINDVKSSLVFDEQSSAISGLAKQSELLDETMSKAIQNGTIGMDKFIESIFKANDSEDKFGKKTEKMTKILTELNESGTLTSDMLNSINQYGGRATNALRSYMSGVKDGTIKASDSMKKMIEEVSGDITLLNSDITKFVADGKINADLFTAAMTHSARTVLEESDVLKDTLKNMFAEVKKEGHVTQEALANMSKNGIDAGKAIVEYMQGVKNGTIRASYATRSAIEAMSEDVVINAKSVNKMIDEGAVSFDIFQSAMEHAFGDESYKLSKQFTDSFLDMLHKIVTAINEADMTKPMETFYYGVESIKNLAKGLLSVLSPLGKAFADVFLDFNGDDIVDFASSIEELTAKMQLSEKGSENLHDAFEGIFSIVKLLVDVFFELFGAIVPVNKPVLELGDGFLGLIGTFGRSLTYFTKVIRSCTLLKKAFGIIPFSINIVMDSLTKLIKIFKNFVSAIANLEGTKKLISAIEKSFVSLGRVSGPHIEEFISKIEKLFKSLFSLEDINTDEILKQISDAFSDLAWEIEHFDFGKATKGFDGFTEKISDLVKSNEGLSAFITNFKNFAEALRDAFTLDNLLDRLEKVMSIFSKFFNWIKNTMGPAFEDFNLGSALAAGGGLGIIYAMIKAAKSFEKVGGALSSGIKLLDSFKGTLLAYQKDLKASTILKVSAAIAVLAGALVLLSFADTDHLMAASIALTLVAGVIMLGVSKLLDSVNKGKEVSNTLNTFTKGLSRSMKNLARAMKWKAIGGAIKDFGKTIAILTGSIIAIAIMYRKDPGAFNEAKNVILEIGKVLLAFSAIMVIGSKFTNAKGMTSLGTSILMISLSLMLIISSVNKLMKMELPKDYTVKLAILAGIIGGLAALSLVLAGSALLAGGNQLPKIASTIKSLAFLLGTTILSMYVLFKMELPKDYEKKLAILGGIFIGFGALMLVMAAAAKIAKGDGLKAASTILAMSAFLVVVTASLLVLTLIPADKMLKGAISLGAVLVALGVALYGAGKLQKGANTSKSIIAMAVTVGVITASLAVLSMVSWEKLLKGSVSLGSVLLILAADFNAVSKVNTKKALPAILAMIAATLAITYSLYTLSEQPWDKLLVSATAMSGTLLAFAKAYQMILKKDWSKNTPAKIMQFGIMVALTIPIAAELAILANQPWEGLLASATAMSGTLLAFSLAFQVISKVKAVPTSTLAALGVLVAATIPLAIELGVLANQPWEGLLAAAVSLSILLTSLSAVLVICSTIGAVAMPATIGAGLLLAFIGVLGAAMTGIGALFSKFTDLEGYLDKGIEILAKIGEGLGRFIGGIVEGVMAQASAALPEIGQNLALFWAYGSGFFLGVTTIPEETFDKIGKLSLALIALTVSELVSGIASLMGAGFAGLGLELSMFMISAAPFFAGLKNINAEALESVKYIGSMVMALTAAEVIQGISDMFGLSGSFTDFADELVAFGPAISQFAEQVKNVKPEAVQGAASAAEIMATVASKLQGHGGFIQEIMGDKSLVTFADELVAFGPAISLFAEQVKNVKPEAVQGAASAAEIMATVAEKLPDQGGLAAKILGDNTLSSFGDELVAFAPDIVDFAEQVKNVKPEAVLGVQSITSIMSTLANNLPDSETLWDKIFGGGKVTLSEFGEELIAFGDSMSGFSDSISGIDPLRMAEAIASFKNLVDLASYAQGTSATDLVNFSNQLSQIGVDSVDKFVQAFVNSTSKISASIDSMINTVVVTMMNKNVAFLTAGTLAMAQYVAGMMSQYPNAVMVGTELPNRVILMLQVKITEFLLKGIASATKYLEGIKGRYEEASSTGRTLANRALSGIQAIVPSFYSAGVNAGQGFVNGIESKMSDSSAVGKAIAEAAYEAAMKALDEHSPSKKMAQVGEYAGIGFVNRLMFYVARAAEVGKEIGEATINSTSDAVRDMSKIVLTDFDPVIKPTVDLSNVEDSALSVSRMFNDAVSQLREDAEDISISVSNHKRRNTMGSDQKYDQNGSSGVSNYYNFTQNNNSPKALSRIEIYRQTKNQFSQFKEATDKP